jgi:NAD-dependent deacetylase
LERAFGGRFTLLTQNVDGLHLRAGNSLERTLHVHGNLHFMRCGGACSARPIHVPEGFAARPAGEPLAASESAALRCARCGGWMRPHVLWFDETYDEANYRFESALAAAAAASVLVVVGTSGATTLPMRAAALAAHGGALLVNIDPENNPFAALARATGGVHLIGSAVEHVPQVARQCIAGLEGTDA